jgi:plasmid stability protein
VKRTTVAFDDDLLRRLKQEAAERGVTLQALVNDLLRASLLKQPSPAFKLKWTPVKGTLQPGVRLEDRDALFDLMDGR